MSHLFGVGLTITVNNIVNEIRMQLQKRQGIALRSLSILLHKADRSSSGLLTVAEFEKTLASFNLFPTKVQLQAIVKAFDVEGQLSIKGFLDALRNGCINKRREAIIRIAWDKLAPNGEKVVSIERLAECYDVSRNSDYLEGNQTKEQIFQSFVDGLSYNGKPITEVNFFSEWSYY